MLLNVAPVIPVANLDRALDRYQALGFDVSSYRGEERYGFADREGVHLHLFESQEHDPGSDAAHVYIYATDADALREEWADSGVAGQLSIAYDTPYGLREFSYIDEDGTLHRVGSRLEDSALQA